MRSFLKVPNNLEVGFEVAEMVPKIRKEVYRRFWESVKDNLDTRLKGNEEAHLWEAFENEDNRLLV